MSVLLLHRFPFEPFPYLKWLADYDGDIVVVADREKIESSGERLPDGNLGYAHLEVLDDFEGLAFERGLDLARKFAVTHVIAHHEGDVETAARLREHLDLPGAWPADVAAFRDKVLMKRRARQAGIETAAHVLARTPEQARSFAARQGFPLVAKARAGFSSIGLRILPDADALRDCLAAAFAAPGEPEVLLEGFVPGRMCHVDGLVADGRTVLAWPSQYQYDLASYGEDPGARVDLTLDPDDPLTDRLLELTDRILAALKPAGTRLREHAFHAEIFHTPDDRLVLCEIAVRPAGAKVREVFEVLFGANLGELATRAQLGLPLPAPADGARGARPRPREMSGQLLMMKRPGLVRSVPAAPEQAWVRGFWLYARPGELVPSASGSSDFLTAVVGSAPSRAECESRLRDLGARFEAQTRIVPAGG
ncbi:hypothetical protein [Actinoplanes sp. NPDC049118]|uniref:ATP-grasp domain-containing protein n=1 Tax=Actinoplanes sp. NPDC049118 TaxID=3155769 RepID=UPI00340DD379